LLDVSSKAELPVGFLWFLIGLTMGLAVWRWQRSLSARAIQAVLQEFHSITEVASLSPISRLAGAIAQQQQILRRMEEQIESYRRIIYSAPIGFLQVDDENRLIWCNPQARDLLGINQDQYPRPRLLLEVVRSFDLDRLIEQTRNIQKPTQSEWIFYPVSPDPTQLSKQQPYALRGYGLPMAFGHVGIFLENRQEALTLMQQRDRWASDVAHELKTPLTSIRLVAETLQSRLEPPLRTWVDRLINETVRLSNLVQDLLELSQMDQRASHILQIKTVDLAELIQSAWMNVEPLARKKQLQLDYCGPQRLCIEADEPRLYRVLINLLDNSIKYSPLLQKIQVHVRLDEHPGAEPSRSPDDSSDSRVCLEIIDAGSGFADADLPHIFDRFYRADPSRARTLPNTEPGLFLSRDMNLLPPDPNSVANITESHLTYGKDREDIYHRSGSGLGLAIVKQIVDAHAGTVTASNHPETGGAWLTICLPQRHAASLAKP
jgi:two-component system, OmpR family, phosphate regulon sensor histidine kinase PhoR